MIASLLSDAALVIGALAPLIAAVTALIFVIQKDKRDLNARFDKFAITLSGIDRAVNQVKPGEASLKTKVDQQTEQIDLMQDDIRIMKKQLGLIQRQLKTLADNRPNTRTRRLPNGDTQ